MAQMTGEFPRVIPRPVWLTARARNAVHRPMFIGAVGIGVFVATLVALILAPQQIRHAPLALPIATVEALVAGDQRDRRRDGGAGRWAEDR